MAQRNARLRWVLIWAVAVLWTFAVLARLGYLQLVRYGEYFSKARHQQERVFEISPMRGTIYDRNGRELAVSLPMESCFADPAEISDPGMVAQLLSRVLDIPADDLESRIRGAHSPVRLARKLSPEVADRVEAMGLRGVFCQKENRRVYPQHELAASVLGYVDIDEKGIGGLEYSLDQQIRGRPGRMMVMADGHQQFYDRREAAADPGDSVVLTLDENIQYIAEKELAQGIQATHAKHGAVVVQNPNTGELLAVANWPPFDPNNAGAYSADFREDRAVSAAYEPGSVFKVITMTAAIENGVVTPDTLIDCQMGSITLAGRVIHDDERWGVLSVREILEHSSNIGAIKVALRLGAPKFYDVIHSFGIGQLTGILLPGENRGLLRPVDDWSGNSIGSIAMGQEVSVTPVQIISVISAVANGGILYPPKIVREVRGEVPRPASSERPARRVTDPTTAASVREMMEGVVLKGTGERYTQLEGYTAAGKTGTAQKIDPATHRYSHTDHMSSFVGFAPVNDPSVTILVVFDSPRGGYYGNETAGPVFKRVAQEVLAYLDVPHDVPAPSAPIETAGRIRKSPEKRAARRSNQARFEAVVAAARRAAPPAAMLIVDPAAITVPDFSGQTVRRATGSCVRLGLTPSMIGNGVALQQSPEAGSRVARGSRVTIVFGSPGGAVGAAAAGGDGN